MKAPERNFFILSTDDACACLSRSTHFIFLRQCHRFTQDFSILDPVTLCTMLRRHNPAEDEAVGSSDEELSGGEGEAPESHLKGEERDLKEKLLRKYSGYLSSLKQEFSKKKKKGKLPKEARQILFEWWTAHYKWPYPTEADKIALAEATGLDQKQINNWFINQRKRHWKPAENMHFSVMDSSSTSSLFAED